MKKTVTTVSSGMRDHVLEDRIHKGHFGIKDFSQNDAKLDGDTNHPSLNGDSLIHYIGGYKAEYEKIMADVSNHVQPEAHIPEGKIDLDYAKELDTKLSKEIEELEHKNKNDKRDLGNFEPGSISKRIKQVVLAALVIMLAETFV